jgi:hypothetical protein
MTFAVARKVPSQFAVAILRRKRNTLTDKPFYHSFQLINVAPVSA